MNVEVKQNHMEVQDSVIENIQRHIEADLERFDHMITRVCVHIADVNGPRGGEDKSCRIEVHLKRASVVVVENRGSSLFAVVCRAIDRVDMAMARTADRIKGRRRLKFRASTKQPCPA